METEMDVSLPKEIFGIARVKFDKLAVGQIVIDCLITRIMGRVELDNEVIYCDTAVAKVLDTSSDLLSIINGRRFNRINWPHSPLLVVWEREEPTGVPEEGLWRDRMLNSEEERELLNLLKGY